MSYRRMGLALGLFSLGLGVVELFAGRRLAAKLGAEGHEGLVRGFGARELANGAALVAMPAVSAGVWARVAGDALDLAATGALLRKGPRTGFAWGALGLVAAVTVADILVARGLDRTTGRLLPDKGQSKGSKRNQPQAHAS